MSSNYHSSGNSCADSHVLKKFTGTRVKKRRKPYTRGSVDKRRSSFNTLWLVQRWSRMNCELGRYHAWSTIRKKNIAKNDILPFLFDKNEAWRECLIWRMDDASRNTGQVTWWVMSAQDRGHQQLTSAGAAVVSSFKCTTFGAGWFWVEG